MPEALEVDQGSIARRLHAIGKFQKNPKRKASHSVRNIYGKRTLMCIWWAQKGAVCYKLLKPCDTVTDDR